MKRGEPTFDAEEVGADVSFIDVFNTDPDTIPTLIQAGLIDSRPNTPIDDIIGDGYNVFISDTFVLEANIYVFDAAFAQMYEDELAEYLDPCDSAEDGVDEMVEMSSDLDESRARKALLMVSEEESVAEALDEIGPIVDYIDDVIQSPIDETEFKYRIDSLDSERVHEIKSAGREKIIRRQQERLERREEVITVLQRILRHNLRNDISVVKGYVSMMESALEDGEVGSGDAFETVYDTIDELIEMSERTHQVTTDLMTNYEQTSLSLADTVRQAVHEVSNDYPQASITVNVEGIRGHTAIQR